MIAADLHGVRTILAIIADGGVGVRASDGKVMWRDRRAPAGDGNMATPVVLNNQVLYAYSSGLALLGVNLDHGSLAARQIYLSTDLGVQWGGVLHINGYLYAFNGAGLMCLDAASGKTVWRSRSVSVGALTYADDHLYLLSKDFVVALAEASPAAYRETGRFTIAETPTPAFAHPVVAGGRLYIRNEGTLTVYDIKGK